jgi:hypothetical protein
MASIPYFPRLCIPPTTQTRDMINRFVKSENGIHGQHYVLYSTYSQESLYH